MCRLGNCERVCQARRVESLDGDTQALEQESCFLRIRHRICQVPSDLHQEFLGTDTHAAKCFQGHWKEIVVLLRELYFVVFLAAAVSAALALVMALCWR